MGNVYPAAMNLLSNVFMLRSIFLFKSASVTYIDALINLSVNQVWENVG